MLPKSGERVVEQGDARGVQRAEMKAAVSEQPGAVTRSLGLLLRGLLPLAMLLPLWLLSCSCLLCKKRQ